MHLLGYVINDTQRYEKRERHDVRDAPEVRRCFAHVALLLLFVLCASSVTFPTNALADEGGGGGHQFDNNIGRIFYGPVSAVGSSGDLVMEVGVTAYNKFDAAAYVCGYGYGDVKGWTPEVKAKLSNKSTGGRFYLFAETFAHPDNLTGYTWFVANFMYGPDIVWRSLYPDDAFLRGAIADCETILSGGDVGGGSGPLPDDGTYVTIPITPFDASLYSFQSADSPVYSPNMNVGNFVYRLGGEQYKSYYLKEYATRDNVSRLVASKFSIRIRKELYSALTQAISNTGWVDGCVLLRYSGRDTNAVLDFRIVHKDSINRYADRNGYFVAYTYPVGTEYVNVSTSGSVIGYPSSTGWPNTVLELPQYLTFNSTSISSTQTVAFSSGGVPGVMWSTYNTGSALFDGAGVVGGDPVTPPTEWPDDDPVIAPEPPDLPEPGDPVVDPDPPEPYTPYDPPYDPPEPFQPTGGDTYIWNVTNVTEPVDTSSIIEWLKKIFYELKALHGDLEDWLRNLSSGLDGLLNALNGGFAQLYESVDDVEQYIKDVSGSIDNASGQLYAAINDLGDDLSDVISSEFKETRSYLYELFHWLSEQFDFDQNPYDDTNIVYWLRRIWAKLGNGDINTRPTDPTADPQNWWDWLVKAIQNFLIGLAATSTELISEIADIASEVMHEFPFSIPWDIAAVLAALATAPITPVFTITIPAVSGWWESFDFVIDMKPFDGAAETIRLMEKFLFTGFLIWKSRDLLDFMDVTKWFN